MKINHIGEIMSRTQDFKDKIKGRTLYDVLMRTGRLEMKEVHENCPLYKNQTKISHKVNAARDMLTDGAIEEFQKLLRKNKIDVESLEGSDVILSILNDLANLDLLIEDPDITTAEMQKLIKAKTEKQKLLGSFKGIWNADRPQEKKKSDPMDIFNRNAGIMNFGKN